MTQPTNEPERRSNPDAPSMITDGIKGVRAFLYVLYLVLAAGLSILLVFLLADAPLFRSFSSETLFFLFAFPLIGAGLFHMARNSKAL